jgi:hypothetical protein
VTRGREKESERTNNSRRVSVCFCVRVCLVVPESDRACQQWQAATVLASRGRRNLEMNLPAWQGKCIVSRQREGQPQRDGHKPVLRNSFTPNLAIKVCVFYIQDCCSLLQCGLRLTRSLACQHDIRYEVDRLRQENAQLLSQNKYA